MIDPVVVARIRSLYFGEHWKVGTIARELGLHALTVQGALSDRVGWPRLPRPTPVAPYLGFIQLTLQKHPRLRATRIHEMLRVRGYTGGVRPLRRQVDVVDAVDARVAHDDQLLRRELPLDGGGEARGGFTGGVGHDVKLNNHMGIRPSL